MRISDWSSDVCSSDLNRLGTLGNLIDPFFWRNVLGGLCRRASKAFLHYLFGKGMKIARARVITRSGQSGRRCEILCPNGLIRSEEHTSELKSLMRISYADLRSKKQTLIQSIHNLYFNN